MTTHCFSPHRALLLAATLSALSLLAAAPATASEGDWTLSGSFARTTAPSFSSGFNPDDLDRAEIAFDSRTKELRLALATFDTPSGGPVRLTLGTGRPDGACALGAAEVTITSQAALVERTYPETVQEWSPPQERRTWSNTWPGTGWAFAGYDSWTRVYRWIRPGTWLQRTVYRTVVEADPLRLERTAMLTRLGVDGSLAATTTVDIGGRTAVWAFGAPQLDGLRATCAAITIPNRAAPYTIPPPQPDPAPTPAPTPPMTGDPAADDPDAIDLEEIEITATRREGSIELRLTGGEAESIGIRVRRASRTVAFRSRLVLRRQPATVRSVLIRLHDGDAWSDWERVPVR